MKQTLLQQIEEEMARLEEEMLLGDVSTQSFDLVNNTSVQDNILSPETKVQDFGIQYKDVLGKPKKYDGILTKNDNFVVSAGMFNLKRTNESESNNDQWFDIIVNGNKVGKYGLSFYNDIKAVGIGDLEIYPEYRNKGYGTRTIKDIISKYKNNADLIYCFVDKDNTDAIRLYKRLGTVSDKSNTSQKVGEYEWRNSNGQYYVEFYNRNKSLTKENYERPWSLEEIKMYIPDKYEELSKCPIHRWRAESGIELIHNEPTRDELDRIWKNWNLMPKEMQNISDKKSIELFGITNAENYRQLTSEIDESLINEDKTSLINNRLVLPDIYDETEKEKFKQTLIDFFKKHPNYESKIDWNKAKTLTKQDFEEVLSLEDKSKAALKKKEKEEISLDIKNIFKDVNGRKFYTAGENDKWLFVAPLNWKAAVFCDSSENQGAGAKWCIGKNDEDRYWFSYVHTFDSVFVMAFNKNYKNLSQEELKEKLKYMIELDKDNKYHVWVQEDIDKGGDLSIFGQEKSIADKMFAKTKIELNKEKEKEKIEIAKNINIKIENLKNITEIPKNYFAPKEALQISGNLIIPNNIIKIKQMAFNTCINIESVTIPDSVTEIEDGAFYGCKNLKSINIPDSVTEIGNFTFDNCKNLKSITIPYSVKSIGPAVFCNCENLESVTIPNSVTKIGKKAFYGCKNLKSINIPDSIKSIKDYTFYNCSNLKSVTIPNSVKSIKTGVFSHCENLESVTIPNSVTRIEKYTFDGCKNLKSITIPNSVKSIEARAFSSCKNLKSVTIPNSVTRIGNCAFDFCENLTSVTIPDSVMDIENGVFFRVNQNIVVTVSSRFNRMLLKYTDLPKTAKFKIVENITDNIQDNTLNESDIQGFEHMSLDELKDLILDGIYDRMIENDVTDYEAKILNMAIIGSRNRHTAKSDSDLDVVLEYSGKMREDDLFDILHSETEDGEFEIDGIAIDVNPIRAQQTGTLEDYLNKSKKYDEYVLSKVKLNETKKKRKKRNYKQYGAFYPYWPIFPIYPSKPDKPDTKPEDITPDGGETDIGDIGDGIDAGGIGESEIQTNLGKILLTEATHEQAMNYMRKILKHWKTNIIEIVFTKKSTGATRKIRVHFDEDFVKNACNGGNDEIVKQIRATNKERDNMVVCEMLPNKKYQFRTIPLRNVKSLKIKDYKTWRYTKHGDVSDINLK